MRRTNEVFKRFFKWCWLLLLGLPMKLIDDRIIGSLNALLDRHASVLVPVLHWIFRTGLGFSGAFTLLVAAGLVIYSFTSASRVSTAMPPKKKQTKKPLIEKTSGSVIWEEMVLPLLAIVGLLGVLVLLTFMFYGSQETHIGLLGVSPVDHIADGYWGYNYVVENTGDHVAREYDPRARVYEEESISQEAETDAINQFDTEWKQRPYFIYSGSLGVHETNVVPFYVKNVTPQQVQLWKDKKIIFVAVGTFAYFDDAGYHEKHLCSFWSAGNLPLLCHNHIDEF